MLRTERRTVVLPGAAREEVFAALAAAGAYRRWVPHVVHSRELAREGDIVIAELASLVYGGDRFVLELISTPPAAVAFTEVGQYRERGISGRFDLRQTGDGVEVSATLELRSGLFDLLVRRRLRETLAATLEALAKRAGRREAPAGRRSRRLEIRRTADGLRVWLDGKVYELLPEDG